MNVDWTLAPDDRYRWHAIDNNGTCVFYVEKPVPDPMGFWYVPESDEAGHRNTGHAWMQTVGVLYMDGIDWTQTLTERPAR